MGYVLTFSEAEKEFFEACLRELNRESKKLLSLPELDQINKHRSTLILVLNNLQKEEE